MKLFKSKEYKRAVKLYNEATKTIMYHKDKQSLYEKGSVEFIVHNAFISKAFIVQEICKRIIGAI